MSHVVVRGAGPVRVGTVYALGRNYAEHAREMNAPAEPVAFLMPAASLVPHGSTIPIPAGSTEVHHEVELVLLLGADGPFADEAAAEAAIDAVGIGIDLTARDLQAVAKSKGQPWARSKGFPGAAPVSEFVRRANLSCAWDAIDLELTVAGAVRQAARCGEMLLAPPAIVLALSRWFPLRAGDVVFTGTPAGVGPVAPDEPVVARSTALGLSVAVTLGG